MPTAYTEQDVRRFMVAALGSTATALALTDLSDQIAIAAEEVDGLLADGIVGTTDVAKVRALARWWAWEAASASTDQYDLTAGSGAKLMRSQMMATIAARLADARDAASRHPEAAAILAGGGVVAYAGVLTLAGSPYGVGRDV